MERTKCQKPAKRHEETVTGREREGAGDPQRGDMTSVVQFSSASIHTEELIYMSGTSAGTRMSTTLCFSPYICNSCSMGIDPLWPGLFRRELLRRARSSGLRSRYGLQEGKCREESGMTAEPDR